MTTYVIDIDGTITIGPGFVHYTDDELMSQEPNLAMIAAINYLYEKGDQIILHTSRLWADFMITTKWLEQNDVKYHTLVMAKPLGHYHVDDKNISIDDFLKMIHKEQAPFTTPKKLLEKAVGNE